MKNVKMLKKLFILVMSIGLVLTFSNLVYAEDEDPFFAITATEQESNEQQATNTNTDTSGSLFTDTDNTNTANTTNTTNTENTNNASNSLLPTNNISNNTNNSAVNRNVTNTDTLAKTGLSDSKGMVTLIVVLCGVSAIYSYKKINDYKKL